MSHEFDSCQLEDLIVATFVDGEPNENATKLGEHLVECEHCARAVDVSRRLDSMLAAQTDTSIDDSRVGELLSFLEPVAAVGGAGGPRVGSRETDDGRTGRSWRLTAAVAVAAAAAAVVAFAVWPSGDSAEPTTEPVAEQFPKPVRTGGPALPTEMTATATSGSLALPAGARMASRPRVADEAKLSYALGGGFVPGVSRSALTRFALATLDESGRERAWTSSICSFDVVERRPRLRAGPTTDARVIAAGRWVIDGVDRGMFGGVELDAVIGAALRARGGCRIALVELLRDREAVGTRLARLLASRWMLRGNRELAIEVAELAGALGHRIRDRRLVALPWEALRRGATQARRTGDARCLGWLVDASLLVRRRSPELWPYARRWLTNLNDQDGQQLTALFADRIELTCSRPVRARLRALQAELGLGVPRTRTDP